MEVSLALHDNDYDPERAISALLDSDGKGAQVSVTVSVHVYVHLFKGAVRPTDVML